MTTPFTALATTTTSTLPPESSVVVVVGNASDTFLLATRTTPQLLGMGYAFVIRTDGLRELDETMIYYSPGRIGEAHRLAGQIGLSPERIAERPAEQLVVGDADFDVLLLLGNDWRDVTELDTLEAGSVAQIALNN